ncbi:MAG: hypothetical protein HY908_13530 [Myxococcales bacterium]|nr:hypothetical protein [Myxococcales bacterium]
MKSRHLAALALIGPAACGQNPRSPPPSASPPPPATTASSAADQAPPCATRVQVKVTSCLPVGFGVSCSCELDSPDASLRGRATLESCVGNGDATGLTQRLDAAPLAGAAGPPLSLWMDVRCAPEAERYCGVLIVDAGAHHKIVDFER